MADLTDRFGTMVFSESVMQDYLPKDVYKTLLATIEEGEPLNLDVANAVAHAMKTWALEHGATHYAHWFQPLSGITSEKHDSFLEPAGNGTAITKFTGKALIQGEPDASSFPNGGLRATFEARGYTAWDPTSPAFIKDEVLCIPTAFCGYNGEALDKKTPLLRSMKVLDTQAKRVLALFGKTPKRVVPSVGLEQEYFLIKKDAYRKRRDLVITGRTLFGAPPCKGQELEEHYFGAIRPSVSKYMKALDDELWALGIPAKTKHNEVAPCQHELAPVYTELNEGIDNNMLVMEKMKLVATNFDLTCLLHEKPFEGINGSGKHNNWSISAGDENLLDPGDTPLENLQFVVFLTAVIEAVDKYQDLLRMSVASCGNDHRLGANEAPPAIISIFLGDELTEILKAIEEERAYSGKEKELMKVGAHVLPKIPKDATDRNRTSPFAFTGNKFEFRMPGSSFNIACTNVMLNTAVADALAQYADELEGSVDFQKDLLTLIRRELAAHQRILFNGNGYGEEWPVEAERRGLCNFRTTPEALVHYTDQKNVELFARHGIYTREEIASRQEILLDEYGKAIRIEALTLLDLVRQQIAPACIKYANGLAAGVSAKKALGIEVPAEAALTGKVSVLTGEMLAAADSLDACVAAMPQDVTELARYCADKVLPAMAEVRTPADKLEQTVDRSLWPLPTYSDMLFYV